METMKKSQLGSLRAKIAKLAAEGIELHKQIRAAFGLDRYQLWNQKRRVGSDAGELGLAYAFLRGVPYRVVEPTSRREFEVETWDRTLGRRWVLAHYLQQDMLQAVQAHRPEVTADALREWFKQPEPEAHKAKREAAEARGRARARARKEATRAKHRAA